MQFLHPWLLLGLALVPIAVLLHVFRAPGRRHEVSSLGLWQGVLEHARPEATERLKRFDWLLLLEILVVALLVLGLAWPVIWTQRPHRIVGVIQDFSASMKTVEASGKPRLHEAFGLPRLAITRRDTLNIIVRPSTGRDPFVMDADTVVLPDDLSIEPEKLLADGLAELGSKPQVIFLVTDNPPAKIDDPRVRVVAVGGASRNAGIVAFSGESAPDGSLELFLRVVNYADAEQSRRLVVTNASKELAAEDLRLPPGGAAVERVFKVRVAAEDPARRGPDSIGMASPVVRVKLEGPADGFAADDEVAGVLKPLVVVAAGKKISPAYARLFGGTVFDGTVYLEAPESAALPPDALVIAEGVTPASFGAVTVVVNPPVGEVAGIKIGNPRMLTQPASPIAAGDDALTTGVNLSEIRLADFRALTLSETARPLMRVAGEVVAAASDVAGSKVIVLGFDPTRAGWTLQPSFVVFWANVLVEAKKTAGAGGLVFYRTGDVVSLPFQADEGKVKDPLGEGSATPAPNGWSLYTPNRVGVYEWTAGARHGFFAANLLSEIESDNRPSPLVGKPPSFELPAPLAGTSIPLGPWFCLAAGILAALWWHFRR